MDIGNDKLLPLVWVRLSDLWPNGLEPQGFALRRVRHPSRQELTQISSLRWYERLRKRYRVRCVRRGVHRLGGLELEAGDPFGFGAVVRTFPASHDFVVLPKVLEVDSSILPSTRPLAEETARASLAQDATALRGIRPFRPGDTIRHVNWLATARSDELQSNEYEPSAFAAVRLLLNGDPRAARWEVADPDLLELLCVTTGSLAAALEARGHAVGLASNGVLADKRRMPDVAVAHAALQEVLEVLARLWPYDAGDYGALLAAELADETDETANTDAVLVTASLGQSVLAPLMRLRADRSTTVVFVGSPSEEELPYIDHVIPRDFDWRTSDRLPLRG
jgi:uncharacterized protein (DUF58 family)